MLKKGPKSNEIESLLLNTVNSQTKLISKKEKNVIITGIKETHQKQMKIL
jgi:hypothetical protein